MNNDYKALTSTLMATENRSYHSIARESLLLTVPNLCSRLLSQMYLLQAIDQVHL